MLGPYRAALNDVRTYAALPLTDRDAIVRWAAIRCAVRDRFGVDRDQANLAEPLIPAATLRAHVIAGEATAAGRPIQYPATHPLAPPPPLPPSLARTSHPSHT